MQPEQVIAALLVLAAVFSYVNEQALFRGRWGYRRGKASRDHHCCKKSENHEYSRCYHRRRSIVAADRVLKHR